MVPAQPTTRSEDSTPACRCGATLSLLANGAKDFASPQRPAVHYCSYLLQYSGVLSYFFFRWQNLV
jgi:hypothetical protein